MDVNDLRDLGRMSASASEFSNTLASAAVARAQAHATRLRRLRWTAGGVVAALVVAFTVVSGLSGTAAFWRWPVFGGSTAQPDVPESQPSAAPSPSATPATPAPSSPAAPTPSAAAPAPSTSAAPDPGGSSRGAAQSPAVHPEPGGTSSPHTPAGQSATGSTTPAVPEVTPGPVSSRAPVSSPGPAAGPSTTPTTHPTPPTSTAEDTQPVPPWGQPGPQPPDQPTPGPSAGQQEPIGSPTPGEPDPLPTCAAGQLVEDTDAWQVIEHHDDGRWVGLILRNAGDACLFDETFTGTSTDQLGNTWTLTESAPLNLQVPADGTVMVLIPQPNLPGCPVVSTSVELRFSSQGIFRTELPWPDCSVVDGSPLDPGPDAGP